MTKALPETMSSKMIACEICGYKVTNKMILKAHIKNKHSIENKKEEALIKINKVTTFKKLSAFKCDHCDYESP